MAKGAQKQELKLPPLQRQRMTVRIKGTSPLIQHAWAQKSINQIREKQAGKKTKDRSARDPDAEGRAAAYYTSEGKHGIPATSLKNAMATAAHKDLGIPQTLVKKALFIECHDVSNVLEMDCDEPVIKEDVVRVGSGKTKGTDLRYRPYFQEWSCEVTFTIDKELLQPNDVLSLIERAGFGVGICEWRPEKGGEFGRFQVDTSQEIVIE